MNVYLAADHRGFAMKKELVSYIKKLGFAVHDVGNTVNDPHDDYPDFVYNLYLEMGNDPKGMGIVLCGSGVGVTIAANRFSSFRCGMGLNEQQIASAREHDDMNVLALGSDHTSLQQAKKLVKTFLTTKFGGGERHVRRLNKIDEYANSGSCCSC